jgi:hypothetical protein
MATFAVKKAMCFSHQKSIKFITENNVKTGGEKWLSTL